MTEGIYQINFAGSAGEGTGVLVLTNGRIVGTDAGGVDYDGTYQANALSTDASIRCTVRPGTELVTGVPAQSQAYSFDINATVPPGGSGVTIVKTPFGDVRVNIRYLRSLQ